MSETESTETEKLKQIELIFNESEYPAFRFVNFNPEEMKRGVELLFIEIRKPEL